ncbi:MAG: hypothetical protein V1887_00830 [Candidatus Aenigmatarchaeota archaeon]
MEREGKFIAKNLKALTLGIMALDFVIAILSPIMAGYGYSSVAESLYFVLYGVLIPLTILLTITAFIQNMKTSHTEKRTPEHELDVKQKFWGRISLIGLSVTVMLVYTLFANLDLYGFVLMFLLFALSVYLGPVFGRLVIKK